MPKVRSVVGFELIGPLADINTIDVLAVGGALQIPAAVGLYEGLRTNYSEWAKKKIYGEKTGGAPSSYEDFLKSPLTLKALDYGEKPIRKEEEEEFLSNDVEYEITKIVKGRGAYHNKRTEKEFACSN
ncbi:MAG: hypothetical protein GTN40_04885 [Candidatus Aenigmarchaeota archaeon]|nr:hypothetical protein [Candidatus Aenigmarchaeota archaeon]